MNIRQLNNTCPACSKEVDGGQKFCAWCGSEIVGINTPSSHTPNPENNKNIPDSSQQNNPDESGVWDSTSLLSDMAGNSAWSDETSDFTSFSQPFSSPDPHSMAVSEDDIFSAPLPASEPAQQPVSQDQELYLSNLLASAVQQSKSGNFSEAEIFYQELLHAIPDHNDALFGIGALAYKLGHYEKSLIYWERLATINREYPKIAIWVQKAAVKQSMHPSGEPLPQPQKRVNPQSDKRIQQDIQEQFEQQSMDIFKTTPFTSHESQRAAQSFPEDKILREDPKHSGLYDPAASATSRFPPYPVKPVWIASAWIAAVIAFSFAAWVMGQT